MADKPPSVFEVPIKACVFDAYGTLFDVHSAAARCRADLGDKADAMSATWRDKQLQYTWLRSLMGRHVDFWQITSDALDFARSGRIHRRRWRARRSGDDDSADSEARGR